MIITISGTPGSGKTSVGKILAEQLKMKFYSIGALRGKMALDRGLDIDELNKLGEMESFTDQEVDDYQKKLGEQEDNFIIEGRLSWFFIPHSFKLYLKCDSMEAARRIFEAHGYDREDEKMQESVDEVHEAIINRAESDAKRYKKYYQINYPDETQFDFILDTTNNASAEQTVSQIIQELAKRGLINT